VRSLALRLAVIALLVYAGVSFWYGRMETRLQDQPSAPAKQQREAAPGQAAQPAGEEEEAQASAGYEVIVTRNIFQAGLESTAYGGVFSHGEDGGLERTKLRLVLLGTVTGDSEDARAIIRDDNTKVEDLYRTGSEIQGARINRISRGQVILSVHGREEVLTIKDPGSGDQGGGMPERRVVSTRRVEAAPPPEMAPDGATENKVPEAQPRRRISFRNAPPPADEQPAPEESQPPPPGGESPPPAPGGEKPVETPPQGQ